MLNLPIYTLCWRCLTLDAVYIKEHFMYALKKIVEFPYVTEIVTTLAVRVTVLCSASRIYSVNVCRVWFIKVQKNTKLNWLKTYKNLIPLPILGISYPSDSSLLNEPKLPSCLSCNDRRASSKEFELGLNCFEKFLKYLSLLFCLSLHRQLRHPRDLSLPANKTSFWRHKIKVASSMHNLITTTSAKWYNSATFLQTFLTEPFEAS